MELLFPAQAPVGRKDVLAFIEENMDELKEIAAIKYSYRVKAVTMETVKAKWMQAAVEYGPIFDMFRMNAVSEGQEEIADHLSYVAVEILQEHFSNPITIDD